MIALADTGTPPPYVDPGIDVSGVFASIAWIGVFVVLAVVLIMAVRSPRFRRPVLGIAILAVGWFLAAAVSLAGSFSCYDCAVRPLEPVFDAAAVVILIVGVVVAGVVAFGGRRPQPARPQPAEPESTEG